MEAPAETRGEKQMSKHRETGHMVEGASLVLSVKDATTGKRKRQWHSFAGNRRESSRSHLAC